MQLNMFETQSVQRTQFKPPPIIESYDWVVALMGSKFKNLQDDLLSLTEDNSDVITYKSGASNKSDLLGYIQANSPVGVCVMDTSAPVRLMLGEYASKGGLCFVDSGAFRNFMAKLKKPETKDIDFDKVLERYHQIIDQCLEPKNITVVAPDVVGEQSKSYGLLVKYKYEIDLLIKRGVNVMLPLQKGELPISVYFNKCHELFGVELVAGLPSNAEALSTKEVLDFISEKKPKNVHFLGCSERDLIHMAKHKSPDTTFTCDATQLRKHIGKGQLMTEMHHQQLDDAAQYAIQGLPRPEIDVAVEWDETEFIGNLSVELELFTKSELNNFAAHMNCHANELKTSLHEDRAWEYLDDVNGGYACELARMFFFNKCHKSISPKVRTNVVYQLATEKLI